MFYLRTFFSFSTLKDYKILGFPVKIDDKKYARNAFYFNLCFVCDSNARTVHYEPVVKKMSDFLVSFFYGFFNGIFYIFNILKI